MRPAWTAPTDPQIVDTLTTMSEVRRGTFRFWSESYESRRGLSELVKQSCLEPPLLELVKMRASQNNGCAYCIDMHSKDARVQVRLSSVCMP